MGESAQRYTRLTIQVDIRAVFGLLASTSTQSIISRINITDYRKPTSGLGSAQLWFGQRLQDFRF